MATFNGTSQGKLVNLIQRTVVLCFISYTVVELRLSELDTECLGMKQQHVRLRDHVQSDAAIAGLSPNLYARLKR